MCSPSGTHGQCGQAGYEAAGKRDLDTRRASANSHRISDKLLKSLNLFSSHCERSLKGEKGLCHSPGEGIKEHLS